MLSHSLENYLWKIVPISSYQKLDVRPDDLLDNGDFRKCETYRGGGGYDQFPNICKKRLGYSYHKQFIVQLYGCNLDCPYCYVTRSGVWGKYKLYSTKSLVDAFTRSKQQVFHLMGGAPALYLNKWEYIIRYLPSDRVFHSDFLLTEGEYDLNVLKRIARYKNSLFAVGIKGLTASEYERNTRKKLDKDLLLKNLKLLVQAKINFYVTFTNINNLGLSQYKRELTRYLEVDIFEDSFEIPLIEYKATPYVDIKPRITNRYNLDFDTELP